ncbi:amidohydrolase family protein [Microbacterium sp. W1N]|uniref:N-acyl-D-amino-acid deacylase family protein n=1 Tax=Microbacterium festucae TaxID=2977531 RepID=UPI0021BEF77F|nr:amidohydrolase family protein [Microbacterium festucae]MCT9820364.1 amidohydrolase family protein [Microbacterium festucae]
MTRIVIHGGDVADGLGDAVRRADVLVDRGRIVEVGAVRAAPGDTVIDAAGRIVLPGFVDAHSHVDGAVFRPEVQRALLRQGVTTAIAGQDGVSYAPGDGVWASQYFAAINGPHPTYRGGGVAALLAGYDGALPLDVGYLVPAGTVRHEVMGMRPGAATPAEIAAMQQLVAAGLAEGALGLSSGLDYVPGIFADAGELAALCAPVAAVGGLYVTHMRGGYETNTAAGLAEVAEIHRRSGVRTHVSHFHVAAADGIRLIDELLAAGVDVGFDMYPYTRGCTILAMAVLPPAYSALPVAAAVARLSDAVERERLRRDWFPTVAHKPSLGARWPEMIRIAHAPATPGAAGRTLADLAAHAGGDPGATGDVVAATLDLLVANRLEVSAVMAVRDERPVADLARLFSHPAHTGGSDGIFIGEAPHPRAWGTFARFLGTYVREVAAYSWQDAARHLAARPAARFGLHDRGIIAPGRRADLLLVDPASVRDAATYAHPTAPAVGIDDVLVAGVPVLAGGELTGARPGGAARRAPAAPVDPTRDPRF